MLDRLMKPVHAGVWLDSANATVIRIHGDEIRIRGIESGVDPHNKNTGGSRGRTPYAHQHATDDNRAGERRAQRLDRYYGEILNTVLDAEGILVMGPGQAKLGLVKAIHASRELGPRLRGTEQVSRMTERQLIARVREYFGVSERILEAPVSTLRTVEKCLR